MSYKPKALACLVATGCGVLKKKLPLLKLFQDTFSWLSLPQYSCCCPARQAYSHSASVGRRYCLPVLALSFLMNSWASFQLTCSTGQLSPQAVKLLGLLPITACH